MRTFLIFAIVILGSFIGLSKLYPSQRSLGLSTFQVVQGGTGKTTLTGGQVLYGDGTSPISSVATSTLSASSPISFSGTAGYLVGGTALTISCPTCNTSSASVTSVAQTVPIGFSISGSPVTTAGTLAISMNLPPNTILASNSAGTGIVASSTITVNNIIATSTNTQLFSSFTNASTTKLSINGIAQYAFKTPGLTIATTTAWTASTTAFQLPSPYTAQTINSVQCYSDAGTLFADIYHTSTHLTLVSVTSSVVTTSFSSNNTMTANEKWYIQVGTPASSPTQVTCTFNISPTGI